MRVRHALGVGVALAALAAGPARAATPELSVSDRLQDRRAVAGGTQAQVLGFEDGRFYANGWHITGEMGGIVTPPLKLLDSLYFGVNGQWAGAATKFTSGWGYTRYDLPAIGPFRLQRTDFAPDGRRGALLGLKLTNTSDRTRNARVRVDAHSELMGQYPWGDPKNVPTAGDNIPDTGAFTGGTLEFRDVGEIGGVSHSYTAIVGSSRTARGGRTGDGFYGPYGAGRECPGTQTDPMPRQCDDGPFGRGTGGRLRYRIPIRAGGSATIWIAVAGSDNSRAEARAEYRRLTANPEGLLRAKIASRQALGRYSQLNLPGDRRLQNSVEWGKQNLADLTQEATDLEIRWTNEGKEWTFEGEVPRVGWVGAGFPDYPWLFAVDGEYTTHANVTLGQFDAIKDHMRSIRDISEVLNDGSGVVVHEVVADGSVWHGKGTYTPDAQGVPQPDFNTDEIVKFPAAVALIWRWTGDDEFRDDMLDFTRRGLDYVRENLDEDGDGWPEGNGNVERPGMGEEKLDNAVYYIRALFDYADMARAAGEDDAADEAEAQGEDLASRFEDEWWIEAEGAYADSLVGEDNEKVNQKHWIGAIPMEVELFRDGEFVTGLAQYANGSQALATRENSCYSGERPGSRGLFHTGCGGGPTGAGEFGIFSIGTGIMIVGEGNYGRLGADEQQRYTGANAETQFSEEATGNTPDEQPGAMPEIFPSRLPDGSGWGTPPNIDRCWTCRSMFMQSWGHYGTAWAVVHQQLGVRPHLGYDWLEIVPQIPDGQTNVEGSNIRLGRGAADVLATRAGKRYTTRTDTSDAPVQTLRVGHTLPRDSAVASVELDGEAAEYDTRETNRGLEVWVEADPDDQHRLVVTAE